MLINEIAKRTGVSIATLRYYENLGLIRGVADENVKTNNYKNYDEEVIDKIEIIKEAKEVDFTLAEIRKMLEIWYGSASRHKGQIELFTTKISEIDTKIKRLKQIKKRLENVKIELEKESCT